MYVSKCARLYADLFIWFAFHLLPTEQWYPFPGRISWRKLHLRAPHLLLLHLLNQLMQATTHTRHMGDLHTVLLQGALVLAPKEAMAVHSTRQATDTNGKSLFCRP
jgi:hypothetical protein